MLTSGEFPVPVHCMLSAAVSYHAKKIKRRMRAVASGECRWRFPRLDEPLAVDARPRCKPRALLLHPAITYGDVRKRSRWTRPSSGPGTGCRCERLRECEVVPLSDAAEMYQRVRGTSSGSVYVVVAMNRFDHGLRRGFIRSSHCHPGGTR